MNKIDLLTHELLTNEKKAWEYINSFQDNSKRQDKDIQTVADEYRGIGLIINKKNDLVAIYEDKNSLLGRFIGESDIMLNKLGGVQVEAYTSIDVKFYGIGGNSNYRRSLAKLLLFSLGIELKGDEEAHHKLHASINTGTTVFPLEKRKNAALYQEFSTTEALEYIKNHILKLNDDQHEIYLYNMKYLCKYFNKYRGIYVSDFDLSSQYLTEDTIKVINIELSKL